MIILSSFILDVREEILGTRSRHGTFLIEYKSQQMAGLQEKKMVTYLKILKLILQRNVFLEKKKQAEVKKKLSIFFPKCREKNPFNSVDTFSLCDQDHPAKIWPLLPGLKAWLKWEIEKLSKITSLHPKSHGNINHQI